MNCQAMRNDDPTLSPAERDARRHVRMLRGFYHHLLVFALVGGSLLAINLAMAPRHLWFAWPLAGWAIGLVFHGLATFGRGRWLGAEWEERKLREILQKHPAAGQ